MFHFDPEKQGDRKALYTPFGITFSNGAVHSLQFAEAEWEVKNIAHWPDTLEYFYLVHKKEDEKSLWLWVELRYTNHSHPEMGGMTLSTWSGRPSDESEGISRFLRS